MSSPVLKRSRSLEMPHDSFEYTLDIPSEPALTAIPGKLYLIIGVAPRTFQSGVSIESTPIQLREDEKKLPGTRQEGVYEGYTLNAVLITDSTDPNQDFINDLFVDLSTQFDVRQQKSINGYSIFTQLMNIVCTGNESKAFYGNMRVKNIRLNP